MIRREPDAYIWVETGGPVWKSEKIFKKLSAFW